MSVVAHLPKACPTLPNGQGKLNLPICPHPLRGGRYGQGNEGIDRGEENSPCCPTPRKRLFRRREGSEIGADRRTDPRAAAVDCQPAAPSAPAPPQGSGAPIRRGRVRRVQVERIALRREAAEVWFNDGVEAAAPRGPIADRLRAVERSGEMIDAELADYGSGWIVEAVEAVSAEWRRLEVWLPSAPVDAMVAAVDAPAAGLEGSRGLDSFKRSERNT